MKKIIAAFLIVTMAFTNGDVLPIGNEMPKVDVKLKDISGKEITLKEASTPNGILVMFSCNTCPYVVKNQQRTIDICNYARKNKLGVVLLNSNEALRTGDDSYEEMRTYAASQKYNWFYAEDKDHVIADAFGANRTPECFLFDKNLRLAYHGAIDDNPSDAAAVKRHHLKEAINEMIADKNITIKETRSIGCTIKR